LVFPARFFLPAVTIFPSTLFNSVAVDPTGKFAYVSLAEFVT
jgi:hypothetical protein